MYSTWATPLFDLKKIPSRLVIKMNSSKEYQHKNKLYKKLLLTVSTRSSKVDKSVKSEASWILTRRFLNSEFCWITWLRLFFKFIMLWLLTLEGTWTSVSIAVLNLSLSVLRLKAKVFRLLTTEKWNEYYKRDILP